MQVVLLERIEKLGQMGDVVTVKSGYARNFLLPQGKALRSTEANLKRFERERAQLEARNLEQKQEAETVAARLDGQQFVIIRQASESGSLYGSVAARDVAEAATEAGFTVERRQIVLDRPVKELGLHPIRVTLHPEVDATITINVARSQEEAELQESGKTIQELRAEEEAEAEFDISELFDERGLAAEDMSDEPGGPAPIIDMGEDEDPRG
ncbi:MAG TPA: 50S ribosomal protein L9 [Paracoccaceae bacterium]|nr:50S ribosomal protein L9 [Paracoccaceae bacterium]